MPAPYLRGLSGLLASTLMLACPGWASYRRCDPPNAAVQQALPTLLSQTGLFADTRLGVTTERVRSYEPRFPLWSDGADKRRWVELPSGAQIDTTDMEDWAFPIGTSFWKEFSRAGLRLETRWLVKVGPGAHDWAGAAYIWLSDQSDAVLSPQGAKDVLGTSHDVPSATECAGCHGGRRSHVLGFSAVQLAAPGLPLSLDELAREGALTRAPEPPVTVPGEAIEREALGYLHANCSHCHNQRRPDREAGSRCYDPRRSLDFTLPARGPSELAQLPTYRTTAPYVVPGQPDKSRLLQLVSRRGRLLHMPPLATEEVDADGVELLRGWISRLRPRDALTANARWLD